MEPCFELTPEMREHQAAEWVEKRRRVAAAGYRGAAQDVQPPTRPRPCASQVGAERGPIWQDVHSD